MSLISILGSYVYRASYDDLPEAVISSTKERLLEEDYEISKYHL